MQELRLQEERWKEFYVQIYSKIESNEKLIHRWINISSNILKNIKVYLLESGI
jgi:hypothetical protein